MKEIMPSSIEAGLASDMGRGDGGKYRREGVGAKGAEERAGPDQDKGVTNRDDFIGDVSRGR